VRLRQQRQGLRPGQRRPLALGVAGRLAPGIQKVEALLAFAVLPGIR
jgi:hypothetical protein